MKNKIKITNLEKTKKLTYKCLFQSASVEPLFGLFIIGYCRQDSVEEGQVHRKWADL